MQARRNTWMILGLSLLLALPINAAEAESTTIAETLPPPVFVAPGEEHLMHIKVTKDGIRYSIREDGLVCIEGIQTTAVSLVIPAEIDGARVVEIAPAAFMHDAGIIGITLPDTLEVIGAQAFEGCPNLREVVLPRTLTRIPPRCFRDCKALAEINLPEALEAVDARAFYGCALLGTLEVPGGLKEIGDEAFYACEQLILHCGENETVRAYAEINRIPTSFWETSNAQLLTLGGIAVLMGGGLFLGKRLLGRWKEERHRKNKKTG